MTISHSIHAAGPTLRGLLAGLLFFAASAAPAAHSDEAGTMTRTRQEAMSPEDALNVLRAGNERFCTGKMLQRDLRAQMEVAAHGQFPFASILSCIDSRTSSEIIFDLGIGDVFNARVAGNVINEDILGSLEYAHKVAGAKLLLVIGHSHCGAVKGAADDVILGNITALVARIRPAVAATASEGPDRSSKNHAFIDKAARMHVIMTVRAIRERSAVLRDMQDRGQIDILAGFYDVDTGKVEFYRPLKGGSAEPVKTEPKDKFPEGAAAATAHGGEKADDKKMDTAHPAAATEPAPAEPAPAHH